MTQDAIEVQFIMGRDEYLQAAQAQKPPKPAMKQYALAGLAIVVVIAALTFVLDWALDIRLQAEGVLVGGLLVYEYWRWSHRRLVKHAVSIAMHQSAKQGLIEVVFDAGGISQSSKMATSRHVWAAIDDIIPGRDCTLIFMGPNTLPIPDDALPNGMSRSKFIAHLQQWKSAS